jgi:predicted transglutaminase-like cysteine proteinase
MGRIRSASLGFLVILGLGMMPEAAQATGSVSATPALFGTSEIRSTGMGSFTNWTGVLARFRQNQTLGAGLCASAGPGPRGCQWDEWQGIVARLRGRPAIEQLREVNRTMNSHRYILDRVNWGMEDYWATVFEFLRKNGDCEDYAISKYVTLRALGWPAEKLRIVILRDTKLDLNHAVLAAYTEEGIYIGDNQVSSIVKADRIRHYKPIYSINENAWWLHRPQTR